MSPETAPTLAGTLIDGRYRVERAIGSGGFGTVYAAVHIGLGSPVALKVLDLPERLHPDQLARLVGGFFEEARTLKRLRHPNVVAAHDVGLLPADASGLQRPYIVMEWCSGPTLKELLEDREGSPMPVAEAWSLFEPLLAAMAHAHAEGVAHRDLKPANIILETAPDGSLLPRVIDFGIAKIVAPDDSAGSGRTHTASGSSPFTPRYAAPEQLAGARTGPWTDVHALALVFVEMITGRPAIGADGDAPMAAIDPVRPTPATRGVDVGPLEPVLARALALRPSDRYPDASAFGKAMAAALGGHWPTPSEAPRRVHEAAPPAPMVPGQGGDRTAPPSSHTLRTLGTYGLRSAVPLVPRRSPTRWLIAPVLAIALAGGAAGIQRWRGSWPFPPRRLHELSPAELDRRLAAAGLGECATSSAASGHMASCERGYLMVFPTRLPPATSRDDRRSHVHQIAMGMAQDKAARFAVDGDTALIVVAPLDAIAGAFDRVLGDAGIDFRGEAEKPPPPRTEASVEAKKSLAAWEGDDLVAFVRATGLKVTSTNPVGPAPLVTFLQDEKSGIVLLQVQGARAALDAWRSRASPPMAYALDGERALIVSGDAAFANVAFLRRVLGGAQAAEIGVYPPP